MHLKKLSQLGRGISLHDGIGRKVFEDLLAGILRNIMGDENEMQLAAAVPNGVAAQDERA